MWLPILAVIIGLIVLTWSADRFVVGASSLARELGVSPLLIGLTIVALGTSAPEIVVSVLAVVQGNPGLAIGNVIGSNIANIALVLGATALIAPLIVNSKVIRREFPILLIITAGIYLLILDGWLGYRDGLLLIAALGGFMAWLLWQGLSGRVQPDELGIEMDEVLEQRMSLGKALFWLGLGLILLLGSSQMLVWGAVVIAEALGVSDLVIGLTIIAIGTSLPELAASITAAWKGETALAIGNIIGSNLFNLLLVLPIPALLAPGSLDTVVLIRDYPFMLLLTVLLFIFAFARRGDGRVRRWQGGLFLALFAGYLLFLGLTLAG